MEMATHSYALHYNGRTDSIISETNVAVIVNHPIESTEADYLRWPIIGLASCPGTVGGKSSQGPVRIQFSRLLGLSVGGAAPDSGCQYRCTPSNYTVGCMRSRQLLTARLRACHVAPPLIAQYLSRHARPLSLMPSAYPIQRCRHPIL
jgi:hypothetical protein